MKKYSFFLMMCSFFPTAYAQLTVKPSSFLYAKNTVVYVKQNINLEGNSHIYLRNESQLVQGTTGISTNSGLGKVSVFQEGITNQYGYHYWCSPVGDPNAAGSGNNKPFNISMFSVPLSPPANTSIGPSSNAVNIRLVSERASVAATASLAITPRWVYKLVPSTALGWIGPNPTMNPGEGFSMKGVDGTDPTIAEGNGIQNNPGSQQRYEFSGRPNDGDINVGVVDSKSTLTGNPYPSALDLNAFLLDPSNRNNITGPTALFWEHDPDSNTHLRIYKRGGYGTYSPVLPESDGVYVAATFNTYNLDGSINTGGPSSGRNGLQRRYSPIGQGFVIEGKAGTTGTVTFKNAHRVYAKEGVSSGSVFLRSAARGSDNSVNQQEAVQLSVIYFNTIIDNEYTRQIALALLPEATDGIDIGMDAKNPAEDGLPNDASFFIDNSSYVIQGVNFDANKKIPLLIKAAANSTFKFTIGRIQNFDETQDIYLHDIVNNTFHNLKESGYTVNISTAGIYKDRFEITFKSSAALANNSFAKNSFNIVQNNTSKTLTIYNPESADIKTVVMYDVSGKLISQYNDLGIKASYQFPTSGLSTGVYLVKLTDTENRTFTQKIIINKTR
ncbi:MAG TPA: T9SS type A sorting domain-containing protein [Flavobacterium sp.]|jgi:hypothetical protein